LSTFKLDLKHEHILSEYLDQLYKSKNLAFERIIDIDKQHQGIDIIIQHHTASYFIDEKAQLHYLNKNLPTFTFELSYLNKHDKLKEGWLFDNHKLTQYYFLITGIFLKENKTELLSVEDIETLKITSVNRQKLIVHLAKIGLSRMKLEEYDNALRTNESLGKNTIPELNEKKGGLIYFTEHLAEKPMNLQLRLNYLIAIGVAKTFH
tara:strand:- start:48156 stop:48776 length:621 start_codon:yes stop_codon:yes gene_type:complete